MKQQESLLATMLYAWQLKTQNMLTVMLKSLVLGVFSAFFCGCATDVAKLEHFSKVYYMESAQKAHKIAQKLAKKDDLLWLIQAGVSGYVGETKDALEFLEKSERVFLKFEEEGILSTGLSQGGAVLVNDNVMAYRGNIYEGVLLNYYKALYNLSHTDLEGARVEFNRANDRQRRAKEYYAKQIQQSLQEEQDRYDKSKAKGNIGIQESQIDNILTQRYTNLANFRAFDGFINPNISYVSGLFFLLSGDSKGIDYLKEAYGMTNLAIIASDMEYFSQASSVAESYTWILLEEGRQMHKSEISFSLPFITSNGLYHFGVALPQLEAGRSFTQHYRLDSGEQFEEILNTDAIIATEFEKQIKTIATRAIISATIKLATQIGLSSALESAGSGLGLIGSLAGSIYSMSTTSADLRIASVFPHKILLTKIKHTQERTINVLADSGVLTSLHFSECEANKPIDNNHSKTNKHTLCLGQNSIIYLRHTPAKTYYKQIW